MKKGATVFAFSTGDSFSGQIRRMRGHGKDETTRRGLERSKSIAVAEIEEVGSA
jgi:hypothetical protein